MLKLILNCCYLVLATLVLPMVVWKRVRTGKYRQGWREKLWGQLPDLRHEKNARIWIHAVSVGEVLQLRQVTERLLRLRPDVKILVTTTTETGHAVAREKLSGCDIAYFPLDFSWSVQAALERVQPELIVLVELELWPNFILEAARRGIPLVLVNGRLSEKSFRGYARIRPLVRLLLARFSVMAVQSEEYRRRFISLGAQSESVVVTGSIKFDGVLTDRANPRTQALRAWLEIGDDETVFIAGSTQAPEEELALHVYESLLREFPGLRLILVPRHPERGRELAEWIQRRGFAVRRRSLPGTHDASGKPPAVGLLDTVGELGACWGLADVAFVGGSFTDRGGQNMLEPAAFGAAVCFGPNTWNFRHVVELLEHHAAAQTVRSREELLEFVRRMLSDPAQAARLGARAQQLILQQQGATDRTVELILHVLETARPAASGRAA